MEGAENSQDAVAAAPLTFPSTPYAEVHAVLQELIKGVRSTLGSQLAAVYVYGSLTSGSFDRQSDIDVLVVTRDELSQELFSALAEMHERIAAGESWCATQLEVAYIPLSALRRYDPASSVYPHLDRGRGERLQRKEHWTDCIVQRHALREYGITLEGAHPAELIDPVSSDDLRRAMRVLIPRWAESLFSDPSELRRRGTQAYVVLSICRMLYTLDTGSVASSHKLRNGQRRRWKESGGRWWMGRGSAERTLTLRRQRKTSLPLWI